MRLPILALCLVLAGVFAACAGPAPATPPVLAGTTWSLERIMLASGETLRGSGEQMAFGADGRITLSSCNQCGGPYRERGDVLTLAPTMACTLRGCPPEAIELERYISGTLTFRRDGDYLVVTPAPAEDGGGETQLLFLPAGAE